MSMRLAVGDAIPSVGLRATDGYLLNLRSWVTKGPAVLLFFGAPTLAASARRKGMRAIEALSGAHERLHHAGIAVAAVSCDSEEQQTAFVEKHALPFLLLSDERRSAVEMLGVETTAEGENVNVAAPLVVAVDREGIIRAVVEHISPTTLADELVGILSEPMPTAVGDTTAGAT